MKQLISLFIITFIALSANAQSLFYKDYSWDKAPKFDVSKYQDQDLVTLKENIVNEFFFEGDNFVEYVLTHKILFLNSDQQIENYNKVYLPYSNRTELLLNTARVISPKGKIMELDDSQILTAEDEETKRKYKYFAFEGITKGSVIEYLYVVKRYPQYRGEKHSVQSTHLKTNVAFEVLAPSNLIFDSKGYNGLGSMQRDTLIEDKNRWFLHLDEIEALEDEKYSAYHAEKQYLVYKLDRNTANNSKDIYNYKDISQNIHEIYYTELPKKSQKAVDKFIKKIDLSSANKAEDKVKIIEDHIKSTIYLANTSSESAQDLPTVLKKNIANDRGLTKLYIAIFKALDIKHELVLTSSRFNKRFDKTYEASTFLESVLFYFPSSKKYMAPEDYESRFGYPDSKYLDNYGLFIKEVDLGGFKSGIGKIKYLKMLAADLTYDDATFNVSFDPDDLTITNIKLDKKLFGYYSVYLHSIFDELTDKSRENIIENIAHSMDEDAKIIKSEVLNTDKSLFGQEPLRFIIEVESSALVEKAGNKYLFKVGEIIGKQIEMYQEKEKQLPIDDKYTRTYYRTINVQIPDGYRISNLDDINIANAYQENGKPCFTFTSHYTLDGQMLTIKADEDYHKAHVPLNIFEEYRKVVNSASDFNKITLVLEKI